MNYNDYQLEDMENEAVNKSNNLKKAAMVGGAAILGGGAAFAASQIVGNEGDDLTAEDLLAGAEAGELTDDTLEVTEQVVIREEVHQPAEPVAPAPAPAPEPEIIVEDTTIVVDEYGNYIGSVDEGTYDGKSFAVLDDDGNGRGDYLAYDENGNGVYERHEIVELDNEGYIMGQGENVSLVIQDEQGGLHPVNPDGTIDGYAYDPTNEGGIHNDFNDEPDQGDWAYENPDYNNTDNTPYSAGMQPHSIDVDEKYEGGFDEPQEELAYDAEGHDSFDATVDDNFTADADDFGGSDFDSFDDGSAYMA